MGKDKTKDSIVFYFDWLDHLSLLPASDAMSVLMAIRTYVETRQKPNLTGAAAMAFSFIKAQVDRDLEKWEDTRKKRSAAGKTGAEATNNKRQSTANPANADFAEDNAANSAVPVPVNVPVPVPVPNSVGNKADKPSRTRFVPPTVEEVTEYVKKRGSRVDPQGFIDFYASKGWMVGKTPMKDWKAACRNAESWDRWQKPVNRSAVKTSADYEGGEDFFS